MTSLGSTTSEDRARQVVMVAGGRGERLRPLTDDRPKPMIELHGRPFLDHLLEMLAEQGFERVLLLLGYRADVVIDHVGDGSRYGMAIDCVVTPPDAQTGFRVWNARHEIEPTFLFMYCDNYWPMQADRMWSHFTAQDADAMLTIYRNDDGYTRDNVRVDPSTGRIAVYDRSRRGDGLAGVELGYAFMRRAALDPLDGADVPFEDAVYAPLVEQGRMAAWLTDHRYYSVGTLARLPTTAEFLARRPAVLVDRDGVLNERPPRAEYVRSPSDVRWLPGALEAIRLLAAHGFRTIVVSNQAGIARGAMTEADLESIHAAMRRDVEAAGGRIDAFYHCPHGWDDGCRCRKPQPGMLIEAQRDFSLDLSRTPFVGDDERDALAAASVGAPFLMVNDQVSLLDHVRALVASSAAQQLQEVRR